MNSVAADSNFDGRFPDRYRVERLLGRGGMGAVYLARDVQLDRLVAIKELPSEFADDPMLRERFLREVRMAASFSHPNIVPVYAVEEHGHTLAFVMGFVEGESVADRVRRLGPLSPRETVRLLLDVAYALAYAHGRGVVHRDIKPDNIMLERATGRALLMDFGVARSISTAPSVQAGMTRVGEVVGTPEYMSPEQATGESIDGRSDLYSLGLVAHFVVTGAVAFGGDSAARILVRQLTEVLPPMSTVRTDLPPALGAALDRSLAKERDERFADAAALIEALDAAQAAAPEIPLAIRLLASELSTLMLVMMFTFIMSATAFNVLVQKTSSLDALLPCVVLLAVVTGRVLQTRSEVRRIRDDGFTGADLYRGLAAVLAEREARRQQLRANATVVAQRSRTLRSAVGLLIGAVACIAGGLSMRTTIDGIHHTPLLGVLLVIVGLIGFGLGMALLLRNPLARNAEDRFMARVWMGPIGRTLFGIDENASTTSTMMVRTTARTAVAPASVPAALTRPDNANARLDALEARVQKLEQR